MALAARQPGISFSRFPPTNVPWIQKDQYSHVFLEKKGGTSSKWKILRSVGWHRIKHSVPHTLTKDISYKQARVGALPSTTYRKGKALPCSPLWNWGWEMRCEKSTHSAFGCAQKQVWEGGFQPCSFELISVAFQAHESSLSPSPRPHNSQNLPIFLGEKGQDGGVSGVEGEWGCCVHSLLFLFPLRHPQN